MKTFVIRTSKDVRIDDQDFISGDQIGIVTTEGVSLLSLLGAIQFHHAMATEVDEVDGQLVSQVDDSQLEESQPAEFPQAESTEAETEAADEPQTAESESPAADNETPSLVDAFLSDGLDEKIATCLISQGVDTPEKLRGLIETNFDLTSLDDIGPVRADKIRAIYGS